MRIVYACNLMIRRFGNWKFFSDIKLHHGMIRNNWNVCTIFPLNLIKSPKQPKKCAILVFHGRPDPDEAIAGFRGKTLRHNTLAAPWIADHWKA